jgi:magnesium chelatase family protein
MQKCRCSSRQIQNYLSRLSEPLLDRMDICVEMERVERAYPGKGSGRTSKQMRQMIERTRNIQKERYRNEPIERNSDLRGQLLEKYCSLGEKEQSLLEEMMKQTELSVRGVHRMLRVARTVADMEESEKICERHLLQASSYKVISRKYWGKL